MWLDSNYNVEKSMCLFDYRFNKSASNSEIISGDPSWSRTWELQEVGSNLQNTIRR